MFYVDKLKKVHIYESFSLLFFSNFSNHLGVSSLISNQTARLQKHPYSLLPLAKKKAGFTLQILWSYSPHWAVHILSCQRPASACIWVFAYAHSYAKKTGCCSRVLLNSCAFELGMQQLTDFTINRALKHHGFLTVKTVSVLTFKKGTCYRMLFSMKNGCTMRKIKQTRHLS